MALALAVAAVAASACGAWWIKEQEIMNILRVVLVILPLAATCPSLAQDGPDSVSDLKARIEKLEAENAAIKQELADLKRGLAALGKGPAAERPAVKAMGPTPYPKEEKDWPGKGVIRVFDWMVQNRAYFWQLRDKKQGAVVFAGDSLTGNWGALEKSFPRLNVANRGIGGDVSRGLLFRFKEDVLDLHPRAIVILIGTNDLSARQDPADTIANLTAILEMAEKQTPALPIVLCKLPPRASPQAPVEASQLQKLNMRIAKLAEGKPHVTVLDLFGLFAKSDGSPDPQYFQPDKLHLADPGYKKWREELESIFARRKLQS
jgi:lysophospholipase L1-like esterase